MIIIGIKKAAINNFCQHLTYGAVEPHIQINEYKEKLRFEY